MKRNDAFPTKFMTNEDVEHGLLLTVRSAFMQEVTSPSGKSDKKFLMSFVEIEKLFVVNITNFKRCEKIFESLDTDDWINKKLVLYYDPDVSYGGETVGGLRVKKAKTQADAQTASQESDSDGPF